MERFRGLFYLPTAWNHLEAGMGFALKLPILIICEGAVLKGPVFDKGVTDQYVHRLNLSSEGLSERQIKRSIDTYFTSNEFLQPFNEWHEDIVKYHLKKQKR